MTETKEEKNVKEHVFGDPATSDIVLTFGDHTFKTHRLLLITHSNFFKTLNSSYGPLVTSWPIADDAPATIEDMQIWIRALYRLPFICDWHPEEKTLEEASIGVSKPLWKLPNAGPGGWSGYPLVARVPKTYDTGWHALLDIKGSPQWRKVEVMSVSTSDGPGKRIVQVKEPAHSEYWRIRLEDKIPEAEWASRLHWDPANDIPEPKIQASKLLIPTDIVSFRKCLHLSHYFDAPLLQYLLQIEIAQEAYVTKLTEKEILITLAFAHKYKLRLLREKLLRRCIEKWPTLRSPATMDHILALGPDLLAELIWRIPRSP